MNKRIIQLLIFILIVFAADRVVGLVLKKLYDNSKMPWIVGIRYSIDSTDQDILIFGSSRAQHHYIPDTITKYTGMSSYNCGAGGQGLAFSYIQIHETLKRYNPKLIILDLAPNIISDPHSFQKLKTLLPYYSKDEVIENIFTNGSMLEKSKFFSAIYPYNGTAYSILSALLRHFSPDNGKGYVPLSGTFDISKLKQGTSGKNNTLELSRKQIPFLYRIIDECNTKHVKLMLVVSPIFRQSEGENQFIEQLFTLCQKKSNAFQFEDFSNNVDFSQRSDLFTDILHLNNIGAQEFSRKIAMIISKDLDSSPSAVSLDVNDYKYRLAGKR